MLPLNAAAVSADINISGADINGVVTISGNISSGADKPVSVLVKNLSVNSATDSTGGIRLADSAVSGEGGAYSFKFRPADGGEYLVRINGNNGADRQEKSFNVPNPSLTVADSYDTPGDNSYLQINLEAGRIIETVSFTLTYRPEIFIIESDMIKAEEQLEVLSAKIASPGTIVCSLRKRSALPSAKTTICTIDMKISSDAPLGVYAMSLTGTATDKKGNAAPLVLTSGSCHIEAISQKKTALTEATAALAAVKSAADIGYGNYDRESAAVAAARSGLDKALAVGVRLSDFSAELLDKLYAAEEKTEKLKAGVEILGRLGAAAGKSIDELLEAQKEFFGITSEMLEIYKRLPNMDTVRAAVTGKAFNDPGAAGTAFGGKLALEAIYQLKWSDMPEALTALNSVLNFELSGSFSRLGDYEKTSVYRAMAKNSYASIDIARTAFNSAVSSAASSKGTGGSSGGRTTGFKSALGAETANPEMPVSQIPADYKAVSVFTDLGEVGWAAEGINYLRSLGIVSGKGEGIFAPDDLITREELVKLLVCGFGLEAEDCSAKFSDVKAGSWYYPYIAAACKSGAVSGYEDGSFGIGKTITREEMTAIVFRASEYKGIDLGTAGEAAAFGDSDEISAYARESVEKMQKAGIISGGGDGSFRPKDGVTRAMASKVIYELMLKINSQGA